MVLESHERPRRPGRRSVTGVAGAVALALLLLAGGCGRPAAQFRPAPPEDQTAAPSVATTPSEGTPSQGAQAGQGTQAGQGNHGTQPIPTGPRPTSTAAPPTAAATATKAPGALVFDPFSAIRCDWVPRLFVDLSGKARPGLRVTVPVWATQLDRTLELGVRLEIPATGYQTSTTITAGPPEWRGSVALAAPDSGDTVDLVIVLDTAERLAGRNPYTSRKDLRVSVPSPRPAADQSLTCTGIV